MRPLPVGCMLGWGLSIGMRCNPCHVVRPLPCVFVKGVCGATLYPLEACQTGYDFGIGLFSPSQLQPVAQPSLAGKGEGLQNIEI